jgi:hypothetical protein
LICIYCILYLYVTMVSNSIYKYIIMSYWGKILLLRCNAIYIIIFDVFFYFVYYHFLNEAEF